MPTDFFKCKHAYCFQSALTSYISGADDLLSVDTEGGRALLFQPRLPKFVRLAEVCLKPSAARSTVYPLQPSVRCMLPMFVRGWKMVDLPVSRAPTLKWGICNVCNGTPHSLLTNFMGSVMKSGYDSVNGILLALRDSVRI